MNISLSGRTFLITGASSGIGRATAEQVADQGGRVVLWGRDKGRLDGAAASLSGSGHLTQTGNLQDLDSSADLVKALTSSVGELSGIFHSAGAELVRPIRMTKQDHVNDLFGPAVFGSLGLARAGASKGVLTDGASIVFMSSIAAVRGTAGMVAYAATKAAVEGMVRSLACELAPRRIRVNSIAAGGVTTEMHGRLTKTLGDDGVRDYERRHLLGFGLPSDVANAALFLLSDASRWITGTTLIVDGGYTAR